MSRGRGATAARAAPPVRAAGTALRPGHGGGARTEGPWILRWGSGRARARGKQRARGQRALPVGPPVTDGQGRQIASALAAVPRLPAARIQVVGQPVMGAFGPVYPALLDGEPVAVKTARGAGPEVLHLAAPRTARPLSPKRTLASARTRAAMTYRSALC